MLENMKKTVLVSDLCRGGAAIACRRLYRGLSADSAFPVSWISAEAGFCEEADVPGGAIRLIHNIISRAGRRLNVSAGKQESLRRRVSAAAVLAKLRKARPRLINVHNIHETMGFDFIERLPGNVPLVWTCHDMWPLTGGCSYSFECGAYTEGCDNSCAEVAREMSAHDELKRRKRFYGNNAGRMVCVCPSKWLKDCSRSGMPANMRIEHIPYGLDLTVYKPISNVAAGKQKLGLPDTPIVITGAQLPGEKRKGLGFLLEAVSFLRARSRLDFNVVMFGNYREPEALPNDWIMSGTVRDENLLNLYYNCADVFVLPSLADNLPNTLLEATAAGTPSVAFNVGGCSEIVRDGETGFIARYKDSEHLAECIEHVLTMREEERNEMRRRCREVAEREYGLDLQARRYVKLFESLSGRVEGELNTKLAKGAKTAEVDV